MEQRRFGTSGLSVSVLSFGTITIGGRDRFGKMGSLGVTTIDTADVYSFNGASFRVRARTRKVTGRWSHSAARQSS
jgi:aryl-alcohol dehydrogenase-like predicted oxidoreductase